MEEVKRGRAKRKLLRVMFPDGKSICYKNVTDTMIATLQELGTEVISDIRLDLCHLPVKGSLSKIQRLDETGL